MRWPPVRWRAVLSVAILCLLAGIGARAGTAELCEQPIDVPEGASRFEDAVLQEIAVWIEGHSDLRAPPVLPNVVLIPAERIAALRGRISEPVWPDGVTQGIADFTGRILAFFEAGSGTIYMYDGWTGQTPAQMSVLVHEMVHVMAAGQGSRGGERLAFLVQDMWLKDRGLSLIGEFGIDPFSLTMMTEWTY